MSWTDIERAKEHLALIEASISKLRRLIATGCKEDIEKEATFLENSCYIYTDLINDDVFVNAKFLFIKREAMDLLSNISNFKRL